MADPKKTKLFSDISVAGRKRVVEAALRSIASDGLENLTFATVAKAMGSTPSHVKYYFADKGEMVRIAIHHGIYLLQTHVIERFSAQTDPRKALEAYVTGMFDFLEKNRDLWPVIGLYFYYCSHDAKMRETNQAFRQTALERLRALLRDLGLRNGNELESLSSYLFILVQSQGMEFIYDQSPGSLARAKQTCLKRLSRALDRAK
ncbi:TetR/AcrR family transcriptional regulator [bacterium]|nr:TetR/AcrR family transcriptional regulator [bacterium]